MDATALRATSEVYGCLGCRAQCGRCARTIRRIMEQMIGHRCTGDCANCPRSDAKNAAAQAEAELVLV